MQALSFGSAAPETRLLKLLSSSAAIWFNCSRRLSLNSITKFLFFCNYQKPPDFVWFALAFCPKRICSPYSEGNFFRRFFGRGFDYKINCFETLVSVKGIFHNHRKNKFRLCWLLVFMRVVWFWESPLPPKRGYLNYASCFDASRSSQVKYTFWAKFIDVAFHAVLSWRSSSSVYSCFSFSALLSCSFKTTLERLWSGLSFKRVSYMYCCQLMPGKLAYLGASVCFFVMPKQSNCVVTGE